jgi:hypothetical protein
MSFFESLPKNTLPRDITNLATINYDQVRNKAHGNDVRDHGIEVNCARAGEKQLKFSYQLKFLQ